jgi:hypothetical protein
MLQSAIFNPRTRSTPQFYNTTWFSVGETLIATLAVQESFALMQVPGLAGGARRYEQFRN